VRSKERYSAPNAAKTRPRSVTTSTNPFKTFDNEHVAIPRQAGQPISEEALARDQRFHDQATVIDELRRARLAVKPETITRSKARSRDRLR
jgi:hypothetical protein